MTDQEQILALAELDGLTLIDPAPDYLGSRDAIMDLIVKVCSTESNTTWGLFTLHFICVVKPGWFDVERNEYPLKCLAIAFVATPRQLCESLLRATGKL